MTVKPIPEGNSTVSPYFYVKGGDQFIEFLRKTFGAEIKMRMAAPDGKIAHAEVKIGNSVLMLGEPDTTNTMQMHVYVTDADAVYERALEAGATSESKPQHQHYGDRMATVVDPFGNTWFLATHIKDVDFQPDAPVLKRRP